MSSFTIEANDTNAILDNGIYNCQIALTIAGMDNFSSASNYSLVLLKGIEICCKLLIYLCYLQYTYVCIALCGWHQSLKL